MPTIQPGVKETISLQEGRVVTISLAAGASARLSRLADSAGGASQGFATISSGPVKYGPFKRHRTYLLEPIGGAVTYTFSLSFDYATQQGNIEPFSGSRVLVPDDMGKILRCDDNSNVTITVPATLEEGFNCGLAMWGTGTVTVAAGSGATKRTAKAALSTQYQTGGLLVLKNLGSAAEFILGGDFA